MDMRVLVGKNFARLRKEAGLTQEQVEERSGFSQWYISKLERGRSNPTIISLYELANVIGVTVADLIAETGEMVDPGDPITDGEPTSNKRRVSRKAKPGGL